ncbi:hypothetical membrane protein, conserved, DUF996 family [Thermococcus kodakarensis KOD1]|uniref:Hypothetical membrane protein, conserved, DUF996 family n=1 Tax=Thermococcus kodakarensis (strain ATCC BAA-918 / JCM 12380 / KOD1) TaxID=69014 RepID=Q5JGG4_THEKO|nr:DUF996 domain-containing protein [Thermococcus kodakarensis]WCN27224.1 DUF996 domain-containing protein [Thermococcus kodakarensis]WCN29510.1 DUF996 domain-containing protein [Thermococcus kodakarensis]BAD85402.1 hypothetical membrane protein, conserved, DUF996 family [Thermococcus kodakarensis KOD1]
MPVDLRTEKTLGLLGSILTLLGGLGDGAIKTWPVVAFSNLVSFIGFILVLLALHGISTKLNDDRPFRYYLYSTVVIIIGMVLALVLLVVGVFFVSNSMIAFRNIHNHLGISGLIMAISGVLLILLVVILAVYLQIQAWRATYEITGVEEFNQVATFLKWGAITLIILVGVLLLLIAQVFQIIAFSKLPDELEPKGQKPEYDTRIVVY